jgi:CDP-diacylglycerol--serine O-phosphatidyltransferase
MIFITKFPRPSIVTYLGVITGILGIYLTNHNIGWPVVCLLLCAICDFFDGRFARSFKRSEQEKKFGVIIDSLADTLMFAALPSVILLTVYPSYHISSRSLHLCIVRHNPFSHFYLRSKS